MSLLPSKIELFLQQRRKALMDARDPKTFTNAVRSFMEASWHGAVELDRLWKLLRAGTRQRLRFTVVNPAAILGAAYFYPTLQELTDAEIPDAPTPPADIALVAPISVTDAAGLQAMTPGHHYSIDADIDLTGVVWTPLNFNSASAIVIEGNNHTISNLSLTSVGGQQIGFIGLIGGAGGGQIRNLTFSNCAVSAYRRVAVFCGSYRSYSSTFVVRNIMLENCSVTADGDYVQYVGMLFGRCDMYGGYIANCTATDCTLSLSGVIRTTLVGGFMGNCWAPNLTSYAYIINCNVVGGMMNISTANTDNIGGFVGSITGAGGTSRQTQIFNSSTSMNIVHSCPSGGGQFSPSSIGGFVGYVTNVAAISCVASGDLIFSPSGDWTAPASYYRIGGFLGNSSCNETYIDCRATGAITLGDTGTEADVSQIGGFAGYADIDFQVLRCYSQGDITIEGTVATASDIAGFIARLNAASVTTSVIQRSWSESDIAFIGGVSTVASDIAGFLGQIEASAGSGSNILNCYAWGSISISGSYPANARFAGFVGSWDNAAIQSFVNCYCAQTDIVTGSGYTGQIPASSNSHGFGAYGGPFGPPVYTVTACYYDTETSSLDTSLIGTPKTTAWLQTKSNFEAAGWNFDTIWYIPDAGALAGFGQVIMVDDL